MICVKGERASSKGYRRRAEPVEYALGYNKIKKGAKRTVLLLEMLKHGRVSGKDWLKVYSGNRNTSEAYLTNALSSIPESIAPYEYKEGTTVYVDCLRRERIQDLLDAWYAEEGTGHKRRRNIMWPKETTCNSCEKDFSYEYEDLKSYETIYEGELSTVEYASCPHCGAEVITHI